MEEKEETGSRNTVVGVFLFVLLLLYVFNICDTVKYLRSEQIKVIAALCTGMKKKDGWMIFF